MRHRVAGRKLGRDSAHRQAMFSNMAASLIRHGAIRTTLFRAKELRRIAERLVTLAKNDSLHARRQAFAFLRDKGIVEKLFSTLAPAFQSRQGGYTRIMQADVRPGDQAQMAYIEYLREDRDAFKPLQLATDGKSSASATDSSAAKAPAKAARKASSSKAKKVPAKAVKKKSSSDKSSAKKKKSK